MPLVPPWRRDVGIRRAVQSFSVPSTIPPRCSKSSFMAAGDCHRTSIISRSPSHAGSPMRSCRCRRCQAGTACRQRRARCLARHGALSDAAPFSLCRAWSQGSNTMFSSIRLTRNSQRSPPVCTSRYIGIDACSALLWRNQIGGLQMVLRQWGHVGGVDTEERALRTALRT